VAVTKEELKRAIKASNSLIRWAEKTYPLLTARRLPQVLSSYVTAAAVFRESGWLWYEVAGNKAFVLRTDIRDRYPYLNFNRSKFLIRRANGGVSYWAVKESWIHFISSAKYYLPDPAQIEALLQATSVSRASHYLIIPGVDDVINIVQEVIESV